MPIENWDELRTSYHVARMGTVSGAAEVLGVHHATVIRHIDALEARLGVKLFQRHARGYTPTEAGRDLLRVAQATDEQFAQFANRVRGQGEEISGDLVVTSLAEMVPLLTPALVRFQEAHPGITLKYLTDVRLFRLEYGEAHVAIRAGAAPEEPDNVVQPFLRSASALYAARSYADRHGLPSSEADLANHRLVGPEGNYSRAPFFRWLLATVPAAAITFRATDSRAMGEAVVQGAGIGFLPIWQARNCPDLVEVLPPREDWIAESWLVTHVDLHRTPKVQAVLAHLKQEAKSWRTE